MELGHFFCICASEYNMWWHTYIKVTNVEQSVYSSGTIHVAHCQHPR